MPAALILASVAAGGGRGHPHTPAKLPVLSGDATATLAQQPTPPATPTPPVLASNGRSLDPTRLAVCLVGHDRTMWSPEVAAAFEEAFAHLTNKVVFGALSYDVTGDPQPTYRLRARARTEEAQEQNAAQQGRSQSLPGARHDPAATFVAEHAAGLSRYGLSLEAGTLALVSGGYAPSIGKVCHALSD